jgi:hypothetical protein
MSDTLAPDRIGEVIEACSENLNLLNQWEQGFIESVSDQWDRNHYLSENQLEKLEQIYLKVP